MNINNAATYGSCARAAKAALVAKYPAGEAAMMVRIIFEHIKGFTPTDMIIRDSEPVSDFIAGEVGKIVGRLLNDEPLQYIVGSARFYGLNFKVTPAVLIPRPETEELVDMIVRQCGDATDLRMLDIATGSGCIAISLARALRFPVVEALDISEPALAVARENAKALKVKVAFRHDDALSLTPVEECYDVIVSNPPYIGESEKEAMELNVLLHEPSTALFVPDSDPLLFYREISRYAAGALKQGGSLWFEINPIYADELAGMLRSFGFTDVELLYDAQGKRRFSFARRPKL